MYKLALTLTLVFAVAPVRAGATPGRVDGSDADTGRTDDAQKLEKLERDRTVRAYDDLPSSVSPVIGDRAVTGHFWGGYDGGSREGVGEAVVDGRLTRWLALRVGASSSDLWGRPSASIGARVGILRDGEAPLDLGVGAFYQPTSIRGDGLLIATVSLGKRIGRLQSQLTFGYGQDPEGDDGVGMSSLGGTYRVTEHFNAGLQSWGRFQLWSEDKKFTNLEQPLADFSAGPLVAYSLGHFDLIAQAGLAGLLVKAPPETIGERMKLELGPMAMLGVGAAL
jgi:hypothetical protein